MDLACAAASSTSLADTTDLKCGFGPLAIVLEPNRELVLQVQNQLELFSKYLVEPIIKTESAVSSMRELRCDDFNQVHVITGTPTKLANLINSNRIDLSRLRYLVLDEADQLILGGHTTDIVKIYECMSRAKAKQVVISSATLYSDEITTLANKITQNALWVDLKGRKAIPDTVDHCVVVVDPRIDLSWKDNKKVSTDGIHQPLSLLSWFNALLRLLL